jgi:hypothetical protein
MTKHVTRDSEVERDPRKMTIKGIMRGKLGAPKIVESTFEAELDALRVREKAHTREGDAIAAARRRSPWWRWTAARARHLCHAVVGIAIYIAPNEEGLFSVTTERFCEVGRNGRLTGQLPTAKRGN